MLFLYLKCNRKRSWNISFWNIQEQACLAMNIPCIAVLTCIHLQDYKYVTSTIQFSLAKMQVVDFRIWISVHFQYRHNVIGTSKKSHFKYRKLIIVINIRNAKCNKLKHIYTYRQLPFQ